MRTFSLCLIATVLATAASSVSAQSRLPPCPGSFNAATWTDCLGNHTLRDGEKYVGEFRDGKFHGQGTLTFPDRGKYVGEWRNGVPDGPGTVTYRNGEKHAGEWKEGRLYAGEHKDGKPDGRGTMRMIDGRKYVGEFRDGKYNGQGTYTWPSGDKYVGAWKDDNRNGQGTYTYSDGSKIVGEWKDNRSKSVRSREPTHVVIAKAAGLRPIGEQPSPAGDELRLWSFTHVSRLPMLVLREGPAGVRGEYVIWWEENKVQRGLVKSRWKCAKHAVAAPFEACRVSFQKQPDWSRLLRALEREGVWDLPDGSTLPRDVPNPVLDGVSLLVEVRRGGKARSYSYVNPRNMPGPEARSVERIFSLFAEFEKSL